MNANELRLGNYVFTKSETIQQVAEITETLISIKTRHGKSVGGFDITLFKPITLTEEWLVKFGFEKISNDWVNLIFLRKNGTGWLYLSSPLHVNIFYVHQLQNLYFALTGDELTIK